MALLLRWAVPAVLGFAAGLFGGNAVAGARWAVPLGVVGGLYLVNRRGR